MSWIWIWNSASGSNSYPCPGGFGRDPCCCSSSSRWCSGGCGWDRREPRGNRSCTGGKSRCQAQSQSEGQSSDEINGQRPPESWGNQAIRAKFWGSGSASKLFSSRGLFQPFASLSDGQGQSQSGWEAEGESQTKGSHKAESRKSRAKAEGEVNSSGARGKWASGRWWGWSWCALGSSCNPRGWWAWGCFKATGSFEAPSSSSASGRASRQAAILKMVCFFPLGFENSCFLICVFRQEAAQILSPFLLQSFQLLGGQNGWGQASLFCVQLSFVSVVQSTSNGMNWFFPKGWRPWVALWETQRDCCHSLGQQYDSWTSIFHWFRKLAGQLSWKGAPLHMCDRWLPGSLCFLDSGCVFGLFSQGRNADGFEESRPAFGQSINFVMTVRSASSSSCSRGGRECRLGHSWYDKMKSWIGRSPEEPGSGPGSGHAGRHFVSSARHWDYDFKTVQISALSYFI